MIRGRINKTSGLMALNAEIDLAVFSLGPGSTCGPDVDVVFTFGRRILTDFVAYLWLFSSEAQNR
jgi:hypothetical protein